VKKDWVGRTLLHRAAEVGDTFACRALVEAHATAAEREAFAGAADVYGYTAEDDARRNNFEETAEVLRSLSGPSSSSSAPLEPSALFLAEAEKAGPKPAPVLDELTADWSTNSGDVPEKWLPDAEAGACALDEVSEHIFDDWVFFRHYVLHKRPLLIRNGARELAMNSSSSWTRERLLKAAGERLVETYAMPYSRMTRDVEPKGFTIADYVEYLDRRRGGNLSAKLHFAVVPMPEADDPLGWVRAEPPILEDRLRQHASAQFYLGGVLMGSPPLHHKGHVFDSLVYGKKLWLLRPPARPEFSLEVMHGYLSEGKGSGATRCVQEAGDLLFVPAGWSHGSVCLSDCVGAAHQFGSFRVAHKGSSPFSFR
jgi:hypothetical protein